YASHSRGIPGRSGGEVCIHVSRSGRGTDGRDGQTGTAAERIWIRQYGSGAPDRERRYSGSTVGTFGDGAYRIRDRYAADRPEAGDSGNLRVLSPESVSYDIGRKLPHTDLGSRGCCPCT